MSQPILILHNIFTNSLLLHAICSAFGRVKGIIPSCLGFFNDTVDETGIYETIAKFPEVIILDPPLNGTFYKTFKNIRCNRIYTARNIAYNAPAIADWHKSHHIPGWYEIGSPSLENVSGLNHICLPPLPVLDVNPNNPIRGKNKNRKVCALLNPSYDLWNRLLQQEYLFHCKERFYLNTLEPAQNMQDLCERLLIFSFFYVPHMNNQIQWTFDLSCLLYSGGRVTGKVPKFLQPFCFEANSLQEAAQKVPFQAPLKIRYQKEVLVSLSRNFIEKFG